MRAMHISEGDKVWFNRGHGPEFGFAWVANRDHVAIGIGENPVTGDPIEKIILPKAEVYTDKESVPKA